MARLEFFVVSESVGVDQRTNKVSVFNILEEILTTRFPIIVPYCVAVSLWHREDRDQDQDFQCILRITLPSGEPHDFTTNFRLNRPRHRVLQYMQGLPLNREGQLQFELLLNGNHAASHTVLVTQARPLDVVGSSEPQRD